MLRSISQQRTGPRRDQVAINLETSAYALARHFWKRAKPANPIMPMPNKLTVTPASLTFDPSNKSKRSVIME
jgi:hypothetical protein